MLEAVQPDAFRESCRAPLVDKSPLKDTSDFMKLMRVQGLRWPGVNHRGDGV